MEHLLWSPELIFLAVLGCIFIYSLLTNAIAKTIVTLPIIFVGVGYLCARPIEALAEPEMMNEGKRLLAEITLVLVLFSDASRVRLTALRKNFKIPLRMLVIGMPLSIGLGMIVASGFNPESGLAMALLTAAVLTPTAPALGQTVVTTAAVAARLGQTIHAPTGPKTR